MFIQTCDYLHYFLKVCRSSQTDVNDTMSDSVLVEPLGEMVKALGVTLDDGLVKLSLSGTAQMVMSNSFGFIMKLEEGAEVGSAVSVDVESITAPVTGGEMVQ